MSRARGRLLCCIVLALAATAHAGAQSSPPPSTVPEYELKAAIVSKFPEFTEWPESALGGRTTLDICVVGSGAFSSSLRELAAGETIGGRPLVSRGIADAQAVDGCHLLVVLGGLTPDGRRFLARAQQRPVLTIGDAPGFLESGGIVLLRVVNGRVRFEVNIQAARRAGVRLSSQLLRLALQVHGDEP